MSFEITQWNGEEFKIQMKKSVNLSLNESATAIQGSAVSLAPVDTGRLRGSIGIITPMLKSVNADSIQGRPEEGTGYVGTNLLYGLYQEYGTRFFAPRAYLRPSIDLLSGKILTIFETKGKKVVKNYAG
jgi:hypothetical protein